MRSDSKAPDRVETALTGVSLPEIVEAYTPGLRSFISGRVANREDAEDILQDVFYQLARVNSVSGGKPIEKMSAWLFRVARNSILNLWRKKHEVSMSAFGNEEEDHAYESFSELLFNTGTEDPESVYMRKLVWQELEMALCELPPEQSEVFCLTVFDGMPVKEISTSTGVSVATLLSRKYYAVRFLRHRLKDLYNDILNC